MNAIVKSIVPGSPASGTIISPGDVLRRINCELINDVLDYEFHSYDRRLVLEFASTDGNIKLIKLTKPEGVDLGLEFDRYLMDKERSCANHCIFCFIDQMPAGMRETLYYKDDDFRLSFLQGNYVTLTNLSRKEIERIIKLRISPINVSLHTLDPELRSFMLGGKKGGCALDSFRALVNAGIMLNCQIVCCPGINDGRELSRTIERLMELGGHINSVSVVPVGLTKYREGLFELRPFDEELALQTIRQVESYGEKCLKSRGSRVFFCADEFYMLTGLDLPDDAFYGDYPQLENGVGMMRLFISEFEEALEKRSVSGDEVIEPLRFSLVTGTLAYQYLTNISKKVIEKYGTICCDIYAIRNDFFGESVTVSGLVTGGDILAQLKGKDLGSKLLIPRNMLKHREDVFLDDVAVADLSIALGVPIRIVEQDGADLLRALLGK